MEHFHKIKFIFVTLKIHDFLLSFLLSIQQELSPKCFCHKPAFTSWISCAINDIFDQWKGPERTRYTVIKGTAMFKPYLQCHIYDIDIYNI